ncbi:MAG: HAD-IA family hydrolase [Dehalococcoidales bacterium]|nr:MAG: HAD-IA family hydrolase [Dehalococcoidales bacterium]
MFKAVFFDWFNTLAIYNPPREELQSQAIRESGFNLSAEQVKPALFDADRLVFDENAKYPMRLRSKEEQTEIYIRYETTLLKDIGIDLSDEPSTVAKIFKRIEELYSDIGFALYDDVIPSMKKLRKQDLKIGLITNLEIDMNPVCSKLGLDPYLDLIVTSGEAGSDKPQPEIFLLALKKAGVESSEAVHVGDQYKIDAVGAKNAGIKPIIIDRDDMYPDITDCPRIRTLDGLFTYI